MLAKCGIEDEQWVRCVYTHGNGGGEGSETSLVEDLEGDLGACNQSVVCACSVGGSVRTGLNVDVPGHLVVVGALREVLEGRGALLATGDDRAVYCQRLFASVSCGERRTGTSDAAPEVIGTVPLPPVCFQKTYTM